MIPLDIDIVRVSFRILEDPESSEKKMEIIKIMINRSRSSSIQRLLKLIPDTYFFASPTWFLKKAILPGIASGLSLLAFKDLFENERTYLEHTQNPIWKVVLVKLNYKILIWLLRP